MTGIAIGLIDLIRPLLPSGYDISISSDSSHPFVSIRNELLTINIVIELAADGIYLESFYKYIDQMMMDQADLANGNWRCSGEWGFEYANPTTIDSLLAMVKRELAFSDLRPLV